MGPVAALKKMVKFPNVLTCSCLLRNKQMHFPTVAALSSQRIRNWIIYMMPNDHILPGPGAAAHASESESDVLIALSHLSREHAALKTGLSRRGPKGVSLPKFSANARATDTVMLLSAACRHLWLSSRALECSSFLMGTGAT